MIGLLVPFLFADLTLGWMLWAALRRREVWMGTRMGRADEDRRVWRFAVLRLGGLLALSLIGTAALLF